MLRKKTVILHRSWLFLNGKENKGQINTNIETCRDLEEKKIFRTEFYGDFPGGPFVKTA